MSERTRNRIAQAIKHYAWGCFAKSWNGAIAAVYAFIGQAVGAGVDPANFAIPTWRTAAYTFAVVFGVQVIGYFKDNPIPANLPDTEPPFAPAVPSGNFEKLSDPDPRQ